MYRSKQHYYHPRQSTSETLRLNEDSKPAPHLIFHIDEGAHVEFLGEGHAVVELDAVHSGVVKIETFQLQGQQVGKMQKPQALEITDRHMSQVMRAAHRA